MNKDLTIIVPTAGIGRRMKSYGPKSLIELYTQETILSRQLSIFNALYPFAEIIFVVGFESDKILKKLPPNVKIVENEMFETTGVARSIGMGLRIASNPNVLVVYGDIVFEPDILRDIVGSESCVSCYESGKKDEIGIVVNNYGYAENFNFLSKKIWGQITFFQRKELDIARRLCYNRAKSMCFGFEILNEIIDMGGRFKVIEDKFSVDIDTYSDLNFTKDLKKYK